MSQPDPKGPDQGSTGAPGGLDVGDVQAALAGVSSAALDDAKRAAAGASDRIRTGLDARSTDAGDRLAQVAGDLGAVADGLAERGSAQPAKLAAEAAQQSRRLGTYLKQSDADRLLADAEDLMRRQPAAVAAGAALAGFAAAARFLKASAHRPLCAAGGPGRRSGLGRKTIQPGGFAPTDPAPVAGSGVAPTVERGLSTSEPGQGSSRRSPNCCSACQMNMACSRGRS